MMNDVAGVETDPTPIVAEAIFVCDAHYREHAQAMSAKLGFPAILVTELRPDDLRHADQVIVDVDLRDMQTVDLLKHALDRVPEIRCRTFLVNDGASERLLRVQANALGATRHMQRRYAMAELRREYSVTRRKARTEREAAELRKAPGGVSISKAGASLDALFEGLLADQPLSMQGVSQAAAGVLASIGEIGAAAWLETVRDHHEGTFQHCLLVTGVAASFANGAKLGPVQAGALVNAALLHDVGKAVIPRQILDKQGKLTPAEFDVVKQHPVAGYTYLARNGSISPVIMDAVRHHHEALDGSGYPDKLKGDEITPLTRILTVCDVYGALIESRPYKEPMSPKQAVSVLIDMTLTSKVDYGPVRTIAGSFGVPLPADLGDLVRQFSGGRRRA